MDIFTTEALFTTSSVLFLVVYATCATVAVVITARYQRSRRALLDRLAKHHLQEWRLLGRPSADVGDTLGDKRAAYSRGRFRHWLLSTSDSLGDSETDTLIRRTRRLFYKTVVAVVLLVCGTLGYLAYRMEWVPPTPLLVFMLCQQFVVLAWHNPFERPPRDG